MASGAFSYKRILLKLSGEASVGKKNYGLDPRALMRIVQDIINVYHLGIQICIVIGGGNIFWGINGTSQGLDHTTSDYRDMLATLINELALQHAFEKEGINTRLQSAIPLETMCETYTHRRAIAPLEKNRILIFATGCGNPYFTTDTAAVLRANEMNCNVFFKGTRVEDVYSNDLIEIPSAKHYPPFTYDQVLQKNLKVMDMVAIALARDNRLLVTVFSILKLNIFVQVTEGKGLCTTVNILTPQQLKHKELL